MTASPPVPKPARRSCVFCGNTSTPSDKAVCYNCGLRVEGSGGQVSDREVVVGDEIHIALTGKAATGAQRFRGVVTGADNEALFVSSNPSTPAARVPRTAIRYMELAGLNAHRLDPRTQAVLVRVYPGHRQSDAAEAYGDEAVVLARSGYMPVAHTWAPGEPGVGRVLALGVLGAVALRPEGALVVTYVHRSSGRPD